MIIPILISLCIVCSILFYSLFNSYQNTAKAEFQQIVMGHTGTFERIITSAMDYLYVAVSIIEFRTIGEKPNREALQKVISGVISSHKYVHSSRIYFEKNMYDGLDEHYKGTQFGSSLSGRINYLYYKSNGAIRTRLKPPEDDDEEFFMPIYNKVKELNTPYFTEPVNKNIEGENLLMCIIAFPIRNQDNEFIGVVTADVSIGDVYAQLKNEKIYQTGTLIVEYENKIIYSSRFNDIGKTRNEAGLAYQLPLFNVNSMSSIGRAFNDDDEDMLVVLKTIYIEGLDRRFYYAIACPIREINKRGRNLLLIIVPLILVVLGLITLYLYFLIGKLTQPIRDIRESAEKIGMGDYSARITGKYKDEYIILKNTFNSMAKEIEAHADESQKTLRILRNILNGIDANVYVTVPNTGELLFINEPMKKLFHLKGEEGLGKYCYELFRFNQGKMCSFCPCYELKLHNDKIISWEEHVQETGMDVRHTDCFIEWIDGNKAHLQCSVDVTEVKRITREAQEMARKKEQAEETSRMKSVFLASMSHEIRTPMHGIIGFTELALDDDIKPNTKNYLSKIKTSAESLLMIINDILDVSKIEAGKIEIEKIPFNISDVFKVCRMISSPKAREKNLSLFCYAEPSVGRLLVGDPTRLRQALLNLLSNAIKFTNNGMIKLLAAITETNESSVTMYFEVRDSGIGMTEEQIERIFQPFMQADYSTTRKYGGTGLGLTITKTLIELMGGKLNVESTYSLGSKFSFEIKFETMDSNTVIPLAESKADEKPIFDGEVLVCEDNMLNQNVICDHLSKVGLKTVIAKNGLKGVEKVQERMNNGKHFDLIFMDIHMPEMDGLEASKEIINLGCNTPIVALTANIMNDAKEQYFESGMRDCLSKPFAAYELWSCLLKYIAPVKMIPMENEKEEAHEEERRIELLIAFVKSNQTTMEDIINALEIGDLKLAHRLVHTLKSVAGIVGQDALVEAAQNVEMTLAIGKVKYLDTQLNILEHEFNSALAELTLFTDNYEKENVKAVEAMDRVSALLLLEKLDKLLEGDNFDSLDYVGDLRAIEGTGELTAQIENMKFKEARETLSIVRHKLENQNE